MVRTMIEEEGVGLAAPQVAEALRLFTYWVPETEEDPEISTDDPRQPGNPGHRRRSVEEGWEGCLSIPGLRGLVPRPRRVKLKARTVDGEPVSLTADGFHARVIQHENDHLDGVVFLDRMTNIFPGLRARVAAVRARSRVGAEAGYHRSRGIGSLYRPRDIDDAEI